MNRIIIYLIFLIPFLSCNSKKHADVLFVNGHFQTVDSVFTEVEAMAVRDGRILALGSVTALKSQINADTIIDLEGNHIYPGLIDAHCHFYGLGMYMQRVDLKEAKNFEDAVDMAIHFYSRQQKNYLLGRGWDQNKWPGKGYPTNDALNHAFPDIPVLLKRVDGHAAIANDYALKLANLNAKSTVSGGELLVKDGKLTGVLIDNAVDLVELIMPKPSLKEKIRALMDAQSACFNFGLTSVQDAGLDPEIIDLIDSLQQTGLLQIRINAMVSLTSDNLKLYLSKGPVYKERLHVNSFKMYADGSLGSRGACLLEPYTDFPGHYGFLLTSMDQMDDYIRQIANSPFQLNTHAIGDSSNRVILNRYGKVMDKIKDKRWRIEHAQVVNSGDLKLFGQYAVIPSVQPTHATSDMYWASERLGNDRIKEAYAYKSLLKQLGWMPLGTDFPVESVSPFFTFDAAVSRKDANGIPINGFQINESLTREQALMGMTIWAAKAAFEEEQKGSLKVGKFADFVVLKENLLKDNLYQIRNTKALATYQNGIKVK